MEILALADGTKDLSTLKPHNSRLKARETMKSLLLSFWRIQYLYYLFLSGDDETTNATLLS